MLGYEEGKFQIPKSDLNLFMEMGLSGEDYNNIKRMVMGGVS